jgi:hypothetical protein
VAVADYAFLARGLLALHEATGEERWLAAASEITREQLRRLRDPHGGFFTGAASPEVLFRSKDIYDGAMPSGNGVAVLNLLELGRRTGDLGWRGEARSALSAFAHVANGQPDAVRMLTIAAHRYHETGAGPEEADADYDDARAARERGASASGVNKLEQEAERLVKPHLEMGDPEEGWRRFRLRLEIASGWHLQANPSSEPYLVPTAVRGVGGEARNLRYPEGESFSSRYSQSPIAVYSGAVEIAGEVSASTERLVLSYQPCDEGTCLPPVERGLEIGRAQAG